MEKKKVKSKKINKNKKVNKLFISKICSLIFFLSILSLFYSGYKIIMADNNLNTYFFGYKPIIINNDQMGDSLPKYSVAIAQSADLTNEFKKGDIIVYIHSEKITTHRIVKVKENSVITKADESYDNDPYETPKDEIKAKVIGKTPRLLFLNYKIFDFLKK